MAKRKIPQDAFGYYLSLGPGRSYAQVAKQYGVTKRSVVKLAVRERWQERTVEVERKAQERMNQKAVESIEAMNDRHLTAMRVVQGKAIEALRSIPLNTAMAAVRALDAAIRHERMIRCEPPESGTGSVEETIRREYQRWMSPETEGDVPAG